MLLLKSRYSMKLFQSWKWQHPHTGLTTFLGVEPVLGLDTFFSYLSMPDFPLLVMWERINLHKRLWSWKAQCRRTLHALYVVKLVPNTASSCWAIGSVCFHHLSIFHWTVFCHPELRKFLVRELLEAGFHFFPLLLKFSSVHILKHFQHRGII